MKHIHLVGPGGSGKSASGVFLAEHLGFQLVDLDEQFLSKIGGIGEHIEKFGYLSYARENINLYFSLEAEHKTDSVFVMSSGFMCYPEQAHPEYSTLLRSIEHGPFTVMLIPSFELERCVALTVSRQCSKNFLLTTPSKEEAKIRFRFHRHINMPCAKVETDAPLSMVVNNIERALTLNTKT